MAVIFPQIATLAVFWQSIINEILSVNHRLFHFMTNCQIFLLGVHLLMIYWKSVFFYLKMLNAAIF